MENDIETMLLKGEKSMRPINGYIDNDFLVAYIRVTRRYIDGEMMRTLEIGNVEVHEDVQGSGHFKNLLELIERLALKYERTVFIESVLNDILIDKLPEYGYKQAKNSIPPSFYKKMVTEQ